MVASRKAQHGIARATPGRVHSKMEHPTSQRCQHASSVICACWCAFSGDQADRDPVCIAGLYNKEMGYPA